MHIVNTASTCNTKNKLTLSLSSQELRHHREHPELTAQHHPHYMVKNDVAYYIIRQYRVQRTQLLVKADGHRLPPIKTEHQFH